MVRFYGAPSPPAAATASASCRRRSRSPSPIAVPRGTVRPYWITVHVPPDQPGGVYRGAVHVATRARQPRPASRRRGAARYICASPTSSTARCRSTRSAKISHVLAHPHALLRGKTIEENIQFAGADALLAQAEVMLRDQRAHGMNTISPWSAKEYTLRDDHPYLRDSRWRCLLYRRSASPSRCCTRWARCCTPTRTIAPPAATAVRPDARPRPSRATSLATTRHRFARDGLPGIVFLPIEEPNLGDGISLSRSRPTRVSTSPAPCCGPSGRRRPDRPHLHARVGEPPSARWPTTGSSPTAASPPTSTTPPRRRRQVGASTPTPP